MQTAASSFEDAAVLVSRINESGAAVVVFFICQRGNADRFAEQLDEVGIIRKARFKAGLGDACSLRETLLGV